MNIITCVDDHYGQLFNGRRQSRDIVVINKVYEIVSGNRLLINSFSEKLFPVLPEMSEEFLDIAKEDDYCFVENVSVAEYLPKIQKVFLFKWNRSYPYDVTFDIELEKYFSLEHTEEIVGNSHENILLEVWAK